MSDVCVPIAEQFYSIQGEGPNAGTPAVFLRLAGCNLCCGGYDNLDRDADDMEPEDGAEWVCDTIDVWRDASHTPTVDGLLDQWEDNGFLAALEDGAHLVITGGEPLIESNERAVEAVAEQLRYSRADPVIEVETNGTVAPDHDVSQMVDLFNVSLKLSNSGMSAEERINDAAISRFIRLHDLENRAAKFKFVVGSEADIDEIKQLIGTHSIPDSMISLMPAGQTQAQLAETYPRVVELCKEEGWDFSPRLHVDIWNEQTGV